MEVNGKPLTAKRIAIYCLGILTVSLGIVLCKKCGMGISPISSIPLVLSYILPMSFGTLTMLFHFVNSGLQMLLARNPKDPMIWLQIPLAFVFGRVIDLFNSLITIDSTRLFWQITALVLSIFFTALGMVMMIDMDLIQNPPDGTVRRISAMTKKELGSIKICYDVLCVVASVSIGLLFLHTVKGFGVATIASAVFVGRTINRIRKCCSRHPKN